MDMEKFGVCLEEGGIRPLNGNGKNTIMIKNNKSIDSFENKSWVILITIMMLRTITYSVTKVLLLQYKACKMFNFQSTL